MRARPRPAPPGSRTPAWSEGSRIRIFVADPHFPPDAPSSSGRRRRVAEDLRIGEHGRVLPRLMLFDLDGTVLDGGGLPEAMLATCTTVAASLPGVVPEALARENGAAWERLWPEVEEDYMLGGRPGDDIARDVWRAALAAVGVREVEALDRTIAEWERQEHASLRLYPDVLPLLDVCAREGVRIGMVTNGSAAVQRDKVVALGLDGRFDPLVISSEAGVAKPDPTIFEIALAAAGVPAAETWFVGDNLRNDVPGALATGILAIWLDRHGVPVPEGAPRPDRVVRSLAELGGSTGD